ncbi:MAG: hypothetical protein L6308_01130 [Candidatus Omnitrophica bacterium]|nr:hypothetical protein [Candidatus Omnitrophota bacterium]
MEKYIIEINWEGFLNIEEVIRGKNSAGREPDWLGRDYGVYQIYGHHILCGDDTLLYVGQVAKETFSERFREHKVNLLKDDNLDKIKIYLGRLQNTPKYNPKDEWEMYYRDEDIVESILIYKYLPPYNGSRKGDYPNLYQYTEIKLAHKGDKGRLELEDIAPSDYLKGE